MMQIKTNFIAMGIKTIHKSHSNTGQHQITLLIINNNDQLNIKLCMSSVNNIPNKINSNNQLRYLKRLIQYSTTLICKIMQIDVIILCSYGSLENSKSDEERNE